MTDPIHPCHAEVVASGVVTPYVVAGRGPTAVLLASAQAGLDHWRAPAGYRVVVPVVPPEADPDSLVAWLDGFIDGLGLCGLRLLVDRRFETFARSYAARSPDRVRDVVLLTPGGGY